MKSILKIKFSILIASILPVAVHSQMSDGNNENGITSADRIHWYTFEQATKLNAEHPKKIFLDMYTVWCGWCKKLDSYTFVHPEIVKYVNDNFYSVKFDAETRDVIKYKGKDYINRNPPGVKRAGHDLAIYLLKGSYSFPALIFLDENMDEIFNLNSFLPPRDFEALVNYISSDSYKNQNIENFKLSFQGKITE
jgi:thioredoxin-related protein